MKTHQYKGRIITEDEDNGIFCVELGAENGKMIGKKCFDSLNKTKDACDERDREIAKETTKRLH